MLIARSLASSFLHMHSSNPRSRENTMRHLLVAYALAAVCLAQGGSQPYWTSPLAPAASPPSRAAHALAVGPGSDRIVLFGGWDFGNLGDTWEWDGFNWAQRTPAASPPARHAHAMAYDAARQRIVLFAGFVGPAYGNPGYGNDTWEWDGNNWVQRFPPASPSPRRDMAMAYDAARQRTVVFGGVDGGGVILGDTWEWDGNNWVQLFPPARPSPRRDTAMAYDAARQRTVLFGGWNGNVLGDTWEWDGSNWLAGFSTSYPPSYPPARQVHTLAYDANRQRIVLFGGRDGTNNLGDTWEWSGTNWAQWIASPSPAPRNYPRMTYDSARQQVVLFGGATGTGQLGVGALNDTWLSAHAGATEYGSGCGNPPLRFTRDPSARPLLGQVCSATVVNCPTPFAAVAMGWSNQWYGPFPLPVPLDSIGMTGCILWQSADVLGLGVAPLTPTTMSFSFAIPNQSSLVGSQAYIQAYALAPGQNALQLVSSNGIDWRLGTF